MNTLVRASLLQTKKVRKAAKAGKNKGKKPAAGGSKVKKAKSSKKKGVGGNDKAKEDSSGTMEKNKDEPCKSLAIESCASCLSSNPWSYGYGD